jgi:uncharacterized protein (TIGR00375 family)
LGLSANSILADHIKELHRLTFLSNSDSHTSHPIRFGREFTQFEVKDITYEEIKNAILIKRGNRPTLNVGLPPEEGKYYESACGKCYIHFTLSEAKRRNWKCDCGGKIKKGIKDGILEKTNSSFHSSPPHRPPYRYFLPLFEIITKAIGQRNPFTKTVQRRWEELIKTFGSEISILLDMDINEIASVTVPSITEAIQSLRNENMIITTGGGGKYGSIRFPSEMEQLTISLRNLTR